jgi:hypothetical protein
MANVMEVLGRFLDNKRATFAELRSAWREACAPLPGMLVCWATVREIANELCKQLELAENVDPSQAHTSCFNGGPRREFTLEPGRKGIWRDANWDGCGWYAFNEDDVSRLYWESFTSGNVLEAVKYGPGKWVVTYTPSKKDPLHRGMYYELYRRAEVEETRVAMAMEWQGRAAHCGAMIAEQFGPKGTEEVGK